MITIILIPGTMSCNSKHIHNILVCIHLFRPVPPNKIIMWAFCKVLNVLVTIKKVKKKGETYVNISQCSQNIITSKYNQYKPLLMYLISFPIISLQKLECNLYLRPFSLGPGMFQELHRHTWPVTAILDSQDSGNDL